MVEKYDNEKVELLRGDPKKAIRKLSGPMIISMLVLSANNIIDSIWVAGLGAEPLAALGFFTPLFLILVGIGTGLGAGANSLIARCIGEKDHDKASNAGIHSMLISLVLTLVITVFLLLFLKPILLLMGASDVIVPAMDYGIIIAIGTFTLTMPPILGGIFRAEGDVKKATNPILLIAILNIILDPIFIYVLNWGIAGAAFATVLAGIIGFAEFLYWMFIERKTYVTMERKFFEHDLSMYKEILIVGIPASIEQLILSLTSIIINAILAMVAGTVAVAVYTACWRLIQIGMMPIIGIGTSVVTVAGVAYGERNYEKLNTTVNYSVKLGFLTTVVTALIFIVFANQLAFIFSYSSSSASLAPAIAQYLQILCLFIIPVPLGVTASSVFQAFGKGPHALVVTVNRTLILEILLVILAAFVFSMGVMGIYAAIIIGAFIGSTIAFLAVKWYMKRMYNVGIFNISDD